MLKNFFRPIYIFCWTELKRIYFYWRVQDLRRKLRLFSYPYKLHLGCGGVHFEGWLNIDRVGSPGVTELAWNLSWGIPINDDSCELIYCEHFLEHLTVEQGLYFLRECYRVLHVGGTLRVAMPSLDHLIDKSYHGNWRDQEWLKWPEHQFIQTRAEMINILMRWWGHQWLYDREELHRRLRESGFQHIQDVEWGRSQAPELNNRETRVDSLLICDAQK